MNSQAYLSQSKNSSYETELIQQEDQCLLYERFCVVARNTEDGSYYVGRIQVNAIQPDYFCWCHACQQLNLRISVYGYLSKSNDDNKIPLLVIK
ncbi:hypothetical protein F7734_13615 [Scytonema sp. UIC 10036]|uniref:hypothetical protein n=1 Tax=Scytonema sp. UIC 10036 TaxID=2304196 RepID=UPI0012DAEBA5|nr:hypothetical protein [Scytonema sp. UIC 10036]MUG93410.1 hypothetical protein [Scytonema sp. UIC 10036]